MYRESPYSGCRFLGSLCFNIKVITIGEWQILTVVFIFCTSTVGLSTYDKNMHLILIFCVSNLQFHLHILTVSVEFYLYLCSKIKIDWDLLLDSLASTAKKLSTSNLPTPVALKLFKLAALRILKKNSAHLNYGKPLQKSFILQITLKNTLKFTVLSVHPE